MAVEYGIQEYGMVNSFFRKIRDWTQSVSQEPYVPKIFPPNCTISYFQTSKELHNEEKFCNTFMYWKEHRNYTIETLCQLLKDLQRFQYVCNKTNIFIKQMNITSRQMKIPQSPIPVGLLASMATLVTDAAIGFTSVAQAYNVDSYLHTFRALMERDAEITKPLYEARSKCLAQYRDVEEVPRNFHSNTLANTMSEVSDALKFEDLISDVSASTEAQNVFDSFDKFIKRNLSDTEVAEKVRTSVSTYVDRNPAIWKAVESAGKTLHDAVDVLSIGSQKSIEAQTTNSNLISRDREEVDRLKSLVCSEDVRDNLELDISNTIDFLKKEYCEMEKNFTTIKKYISENE